MSSHLQPVATSPLWMNTLRTVVSDPNTVTTTSAIQALAQGVLALHDLPHLNEHEILERAQQGNDPRGSLLEVNNMLRFYPTHEAAHLCRAKIVFTQLKKQTSGDVAQAEESVGFLESRKPSEYWSLAFRGEILRRDGKLTKAQELFKKAVAVDPNNAFAYQKRGAILLETDRKEALQLLDKAIELDSQNSVAYENRGSINLSNGAYDKALEDFNKAIELDSTSDFAYAMRGENHRLKGVFDQALTDVEEAIRLNSARAEAYVTRGALRLRNKELQDALDDLNKAMALSQVKIASPFRLRGHVYKQMGEQRKALADYNQAIVLSPDAIAHLSRAMLILRDFTQPDSAELSLAEESVKVLENQRPLNYWTFALRAELCRKKGERSKALELFEKAIAVHDKNAFAYEKRGKLHLTNGENDKALDDFNKAIELDSSWGDVYALRGDVHRLKGDDKKALKDAEEAIRLNSACAMAYAVRAAIHMKEKSLNSALADVNRAINFGGRACDTYRLRAVIFRQMGEYDKALADYQQVLELSPDDAEAHLDYVQIALVNFDKASDFYQDQARKSCAFIKAHKPSDYWTLALQGEECRRAFNNLKFPHNFIPAIAFFDQAIAMNPNIAFAYEKRAATYFAAQDLDNAKKDLLRALELGPNNRILAMLGAISLHEDSYDSARSYCDRAIALNRKNVGVFETRGTAYLKQNNDVAALQDFDEAIKLNPSGCAASTYGQRGKIFGDRKQFDKAIDDVNRAISHSLDQQYVGEMRGYLKVLMENHAAAKAEAAKKPGIDRQKEEPEATTRAPASNLLDMPLDDLSVGSAVVDLTSTAAQTASRTSARLKQKRVKGSSVVKQTLTTAQTDPNRSNVGQKRKKSDGNATVSQPLQVDQSLVDRENSAGSEGESQTSSHKFPRSAQAGSHIPMDRGTIEPEDEEVVGVLTALREG